MTRDELVEAMRAIARVLTEEINRPGENEHRYQALKRAEGMALDALEKSASRHQEGDLMDALVSLVTAFESYEPVDEHLGAARAAIEAHERNNPTKET